MDYTVSAGMFTMDGKKYHEAVEHPFYHKLQFTQKEA